MSASLTDVSNYNAFNSLIHQRAFRSAAPREMSLVTSQKLKFGGNGWFTRLALKLFFAKSIAANVHVFYGRL